MDGRDTEGREELDRLLAGGDSEFVKAKSIEADMRRQMGLDVRPDASRTEDQIRMQTGELHDGDILMTMGEQSQPEGLMPEYELVTSSADTAFMERMKAARDASRG